MRRLPAVLALVAMAAGCGSDPGLPEFAESVECTVPCETLTDWVSYADHVAYIDVTAERELPFEQLEGEPDGNGYIPRDVTADVGDVLWTRDGAPPLPTELTWDAEGWAVDDGERVPVVFGVRVEVGERYLAVLARMTGDGEPVWYPVAPDALFTVDGEGVPQGTGPDTPARRALAGESPDAIAALLAATPPDPVAAEYFDLDPVARFNAVVLEELPELPGFVKVVGDIGSPGYVRAADLPRTEGPSPEAIPVYGEDGRIHIDTFTPGVGVLHR